MNVEYKIYEMRLKDQGKELFREELEVLRPYTIARDPNSTDNQLILIGKEYGEEKVRKTLPLKDSAVSRYAPAIKKYGSLIITVFGDDSDLDIQLYSPSTTTFPVLVRYKDQIVGVPLGQTLSLKHEFGRLRNGFTVDLYIYRVSTDHYIGSIEVSDNERI